MIDILMYTGLKSKDVTPVSVGVKVDTMHDLDPNLLSFPKLITHLILPYVKYLL